MKKISIISSIIGLVVIALFIYLFMPQSPVTNKKTKSFALPSPEDIIKDEETGLLVVKDVIMITFAGGTEQSAIDDIIKGINGTIIGYDKEHNLYQVKIGGANLKDTQSKTLELMTKYRQIEVAMIQTVSAAKNPGWQNRDSNSTATEQFSSMANPK